MTCKQCWYIVVKPSSDQCWNIINWTFRSKILWNLNRNPSSFKKMHRKMSFGKWRPFCTSHNMLNYAYRAQECVVIRSCCANPFADALFLKLCQFWNPCLALKAPVRWNNESWYNRVISVIRTRCLFIPMPLFFDTSSLFILICPTGSSV